MRFLNVTRPVRVTSVRVSFDHRTPAVSGELLQRSRGIDPPKVKTVTGTTPEMTCSGSGAAPASSSRFFMNHIVGALLIAITYFALGWWMGSLYR